MKEEEKKETKGPTRSGPLPSARCAKATWTTTEQDRWVIGRNEVIFGIKISLVSVWLNFISLYFRPAALLQVQLLVPPHDFFWQGIGTVWSVVTVKAVDARRLWAAAVSSWRGEAEAICSQVSISYLYAFLGMRRQSGSMRRRQTWWERKSTATPCACLATSNINHF